MVAGFGPCGSGVAERARGLGAQVIVTEVDPVRALAAIMQGFRVMPALQAAAVAEVVITATGSREVISAAELGLLPDGAVLANAGHFDVEIDVPALADQAVEVNRCGPAARRRVRAGRRRRLILLAEGRVVNLVAAEGNPAAVMDTSFAVQALALAWLAGPDRPASAEGQVLAVPEAIDAEVARLTVASLGTQLDTLTPAQLAYLDSWRLGS